MTIREFTTISITSTSNSNFDRFIFLESTTSTNDEARRLGIEGAADGTIVVAKKQTASRGRLGRKWESPSGGLWLSMISRIPAGADENITRVSLAAGVAALAALDRIFESLGVTGSRPGLGWPNDLLVADKKIAGILCEACFEGSGPFVVVGVGVNLNNSAALLPPEIAGMSISARDIAGAEFPRGSALAEIAAALDNVIPLVLQSNEAWSKVLEKWRDRCILLGREVALSSPGAARTKAVAVGIDEFGRLIARDSDGSERAIEYGETTLSR